MIYCIDAYIYIHNKVMGRVAIVIYILFATLPGKGHKLLQWYQKWPMFLIRT